MSLTQTRAAPNLLGSAQVINSINTTPPPPGHRLHVARLDRTQDWDLREVHEMAGRLAGALLEAGLRRGDRIGVLAPNCLEWVLLDLAALRIGAVTVGFDPAKFGTDPALIPRYGLAVLFADGAGGGDDDLDDPDGRVRPITDARALAATAGAEPPEPVHYEPDDVTTLKLTSGSTGEPKGMTASVGSIDSGIAAVQEIFRHGERDNLFVFLPLAVLQQRYWVYSALHHGHDVTLSTYEAAFPTLRRIKPTVVMGVPGFFATAKAYIERQVARTGPETPPAEALAEGARRVFGDRIRYLWTGSAPAAGDVLRFFTDAGLPIYEGYGLNETCIVTKNHPGAHRPGSVGKVLPHKEVLIGDDGVVSVRSRFPVCGRYEFAPPGASERMFPEPGLVRTGDLGELDEDGYLYIRGRADDVIVLENGRKVVVQPVEDHLRTSPAIGECVLFCPTQTYLVAVVSPASVPADTEAIAGQLARTNAAFGADEQIRKVVVAPEPFSTGNGLLTSQFKPLRARIADRFHDEIHDPKGSLHVC
ncbi:AMP-binding protein [Amycolatopsis magusensis]|uniref:AMP-binding protein n=1 Tax=Amycolatopsis magusensis TaxID=882444 RepID=UPI0024A8E9C0|nr:AMP-binding protein [Amycolatopsis magusensis]MDI5975743.1 AMP-binding protein [Amycolatopsis magusensis]